MFVSAELIGYHAAECRTVHAWYNWTLIKRTSALNALAVRLTLVRDRDSELWLVEDTHDGSELSKSLRAVVQNPGEDTRIKVRRQELNNRERFTSSPISMAALLANPENTICKIVVIGVGNIEFEGNALSFDKDALLNNADGQQPVVDIGFPNPVITPPKRASA